jgi:hypothetical protein
MLTVIVYLGVACKSLVWHYATLGKSLVGWIRRAGQFARVLSAPACRGVRHCQFYCLDCRDNFPE